MRQIRHKFMMCCFFRDGGADSSNWTLDQRHSMCYDDTVSMLQWLAVRATMSPSWISGWDVSSCRPASEYKLLTASGRPRLTVESSLALHVRLILTLNERRRACMMRRPQSTYNYQLPLPPCRWTQVSPLAPFILCRLPPALPRGK